MNPTTRTAAALGVATVALVSALGPAQAATRTVAPAQHRATVSATGQPPHGVPGRLSS
ncbi:hypothetical protein [Streptomyces sp. NPDC002676]